MCRSWWFTLKFHLQVLVLYIKIPSAASQGVVLGDSSRLHIHVWCPWVQLAFKKASVNVVHSYSFMVLNPSKLCWGSLVWLYLTKEEKTEWHSHRSLSWSLFENQVDWKYIVLFGFKPWKLVFGKALRWMNTVYEQVAYVVTCKYVVWLQLGFSVCCAFLG